MAPRILVIEDEINIAQGMMVHLQAEGFIAHNAVCGEDGLKIYNDFDLLILDLMLPGISGIEVLKQIRLVDPRLPVIIVSARSDEDDLLQGLAAGADDYVTKPFSLKELVLRIKRALERKTLYGSIFQEQESVKIGNEFYIDFSNLKAYTKEGEKQLTNQEAKVLHYLIQNAGRIISRQELLEKIWGYQSEIETRTVDNFIVRFRKYFELNPKRPKHFVTKRSVGYLFRT